MTTAALVLAAHGSGDPRAADTIEAIAARCRRLRPELDVRVGYLDHGPPDLAMVAEPPAVVVPLLLTAGFHARSDVPRQAPGAVVTEPLGPDRRLVTALSDRLREAGWGGEGQVVLAAAGSSDPSALDDVALTAQWLSDAMGTEVRAAFASAGTPRLSEVAAETVATYLLAPGVFADAVAAAGGVVAAPIGDHPTVAQIVLDRYDSAAPSH